MTRSTSSGARFLYAHIVVLSVALFALTSNAADGQKVFFTVAPVSWPVYPSATARLRVDGPLLIVEFERLIFRIPQDGATRRVVQGMRLSLTQRGDLTTRRLSNWVPLGTEIYRGNTEKVANVEATIPVDGIILRELEQYELWLEVFSSEDGGAVQQAPPDWSGFIAAMARPKIDISRLLR